MFKKKKGFFSKLFRKANMSSGVVITIISIAAIGTILYGASHFSKAYNDGKFLSELSHIKTSAELLEKARSYDYDYVGYNNSKNVNDMITQIKNATPNVGNMIGDSNNNDGNTDSSTNDDENRIVLYNPDVSGSGNLIQNNNDIVKKTKAYLIFLKNRKFSKELEGLYKYYGYISGYNVYNIKTNNYFAPLILGNDGNNVNSNDNGTNNDSSNWSSDGVCNAGGNDYGLQVESDNTYNKIFYLDNTDDPDCVYVALHDKDNFASGVKFVLNTDLNFSGANMQYDTLNDNLDLSGYNSTGDTFLPIGGYDDDNSNSAGGDSGFNSAFSGNNYKITIGNINYSDNDMIGFFGNIGSEGKISDLNLEIGNVNGNNYIGGFVGGNFDGIISNSSVVVNTVNGNGYSSIGGFVGWSNGTIKNSSAVVKIVNGNNYIGGFVGFNVGTIENSSIVVNTVKEGGGEVGGFVGYNYYGTISNSSVVVNTVNGDDYIGGFAGYNYNGTIESSLAVVNNVNGSSDIGGFVGYNDGGTYTDDVVRILNLDNNSDVSAGYYENNNNQTSSTSVSKEQFFFEDPNGNNNGLEYTGNDGGGNLTITAPTDKEFNTGNFPSAFSSNNNNWGQNYILDNLNNYWTNW